MIASAGLLHQNQDPNREWDPDTWERFMCMKEPEKLEPPRPIVADPTFLMESQTSLAKTSPEAGAL